MRKRVWTTNFCSLTPAKDTTLTPTPQVNLEDVPDKVTVKNENPKALVDHPLDIEGSLGGRLEDHDNEETPKVQGIDPA